MKRNPIASAIKIALYSGLIASVAFTGVASAQGNETDDESVEKLEKTVVTGSRIKRTDLEGVSPVVTVTRDELVASGHNTLQDFVRTLTIASGNNADDNNNSFANGTSTLNLRGLGGNATLVLINGRRVASYGQGQNITESFVDLNSIPVAAIERIDILKDGASAIYGADAVAGVVNIILRRDYQGAEYTIGYQVDTDGDTPQTSFNAIIGAGNDRTSFTTTFSYLKREALFYRDRDFSVTADQRANGGVDQRSTFGYPGTAITDSSGIQAAPGCSPDLVRPQFGGTVCSLNYNEFINFYPATERFGTSMYMNHEISDNVNLYIDSSFQRNRSINIAAPAPYVGPYGPLGFSTLDILPGGAGGAAAGLTFGGLALFLPESNPFNVLGEDAGLLHRPVDFGPRTGEINANSYRFITGVEGLIGETSWDYDVNVGYTRNDILVENRNSINAISLQQLMLGVPDPAGSGDTLYYNPFGANDQRVIDYAKVVFENRNTSWEKSATANFSGLLMELPAGDLGMAFGVEYRESYLSNEADSLRNTGSLVGTGAASDTFGNRDQYSVYAELAIPVLENLEVQVAGRFEDYSDFGTTTTPKIGARWQVNDDLVVRGSWGESFRAPSLQELFNGSVTSFAGGLVDPVRCPDPIGAVAGQNGNATDLSGIDCGNGQNEINNGGNPGLQPEESTSWNVGVVWSPDFFDGFSVVFDYFNFEHENIIGNLPLGSILEINDPRQVIRIGGPTTPILSINNGPINGALQEVTGWDLTLGYTFELANGIMTLANTATYYEKFDFFTSNVVDGVVVTNPEPINGTGNNNLGNFPRLIDNFSVNYAYGDHIVTAIAQYRSGIDASVNTNEIGYIATASSTTFNVNYTYQLNETSNVQIGCINCGDKTPVFNPGPRSESGYFTSLDDARGTVVYVRWNQQF
ncbi:MAG: TonB-dependent receptor [Proteobacteria bacterium]|nr:TonB-dependent receptor [Pseudomonadota bacterium]